MSLSAADVPAGYPNIKKIESALGTMGRRKTAGFLFLSLQSPYDRNRHLYGGESFDMVVLNKITLPHGPPPLADHRDRGGNAGVGPRMRSVYINQWDQRILSVN